MGRFCWKLVGPLLDKRTREKCQIYGSDMTVIEEELGWEKGELQKMLNSEVVDSEEERHLRKLVGDANAAALVEELNCSAIPTSISPRSLHDSLSSPKEI